MIDRRNTPEFPYAPVMVRPARLTDDDVAEWLSTRTAWARTGGALVRTFSFADFAAALAFTVQVGCRAEKRDHHPDVALSYGKARVLWTTHDAGGITALDLELAAACDGIYDAGQPRES